MKAKHLPYLLAIASLTTACSRTCDDVVCETYVHRYGVPLTPEEWSDRGEDGQVVSVRKDGVTVTRTYDAGTLHGETTYSFPHRETIQRREVYEQGQLAQEYINYSNGMPYKQIAHLSPTQERVIIWYDSGSPQCQEDYENGLLVQGEYFTPNQVTESKVENLNGARYCRDRYGQLESIDEIHDGHMTLRTTYHPNGAPQSVTPCVNSLPEGQKSTFLPGGEPNTIEAWTRGYQHGPTTLFENGERIATVPYVKGQKHGTEYRYREDGQTVVEEISWVQGQRHGPCYTYVGPNKQTSWYYRDRAVNKQTFDALCNQE